MIDVNTKLNRYLGAVARTFGSEVNDALQIISENAPYTEEAEPLQLLALRRYIRKEKHLQSQWVWSDAQCRAFEKSREAAAVRLEVQKVTEAFENANPGYTLATSPIRDLHRQVKLWNRNSTVHTAASDLKKKALAELARAQYADIPDPADVHRFRAFLRHADVQPEPTSAAPGLSDHGQMRAIDFVILKGGRIVAGTNSGSVTASWNLPGWTRRLKEAVVASKSRFTGPLEHPREPWHYVLER